MALSKTISILSLDSLDRICDLVNRTEAQKG